MPSFSRPSLTTREYSSTRSESSTAFGSLSIGACVWDGVIVGRRGLSGKLGSLVPMLEHCWHTMRVAPSTSDFPGLSSIFKPPRLRVEVVQGVEEFIEKGGNVFCKHVQDVDPELRPAEEVLVVDGKDRLLAVGRSFFNAEEMLSFKIGVAVKVRHGIQS